jgi:hypothetical protein
MHWFGVIPFFNYFCAINKFKYKLPYFQFIMLSPIMSESTKNQATLIINVLEI